MVCLVQMNKLNGQIFSSSENCLLLQLWHKDRCLWELECVSSKLLLLLEVVCTFVRSSLRTVVSSVGETWRSEFFTTVQFLTIMIQIPDDYDGVVFDAVKVDFLF
jgi:hypothetical protein